MNKQDANSGGVVGDISSKNDGAIVTPAENTYSIYGRNR